MSKLKKFLGLRFCCLCRHEPVIETSKEAAGSRHAWWLKFGRIDRQERAILGVSVEINQISDAPGLDGVVNLFLFLVELRKIGC